MDGGDPGGVGVLRLEDKKRAVVGTTASRFPIEEVLLRIWNSSWSVGVCSSPGTSESASWLQLQLTIVKLVPSVDGIGDKLTGTGHWSTPLVRMSLDE